MKQISERGSHGVSTGRRGLVQRLHGAKRWLYRGGRPQRMARALNRLWAMAFSAGVLSADRCMTLEVRGHRTGKTISLPVVVAEYHGQRYLVSMLGENASWVRNVRAAGGQAVLRRHGARDVRLLEVAPGERAPILRSYLNVAPGARPHVPVDRHAPIEEFERIAGQYPVFLIVPAAEPAPAATSTRK
ncbi:MAG TPA: nitroreductase/quinone reductase family protein [Dermatophilaceae bacterium]|nr:nitroreductase/quinone reductase family protein [Dermatophilaceae bacterium]